MGPDFGLGLDRVSAVERSRRCRVALGDPWHTGADALSCPGSGDGFLVLTPRLPGGVGARPVDRRGRLTLAVADRAMLGGANTVLVAHVVDRPLLVLLADWLLGSPDGYAAFLRALAALM